MGASGEEDFEVDADTTIEWLRYIVGEVSKMFDSSARQPRACTEEPSVRESCGDKIRPDAYISAATTQKAVILRQR